jgi:opacity protein-like surface antigen
MAPTIRHARAACFSVALLAGVALPAPSFADATIFLGANGTPSNRPVRGIAVGVGLLIVAFEFEYAGASEDQEAGAPSLRTGMGNVLLQTPVAFAGLQPYVTAGAGAYRETLDSHGQTGVGTNVGAGVKVSLAGPLRLRVDYRVFRLGSGARYSPAHRVYGGLNLKF